MRTLKLLSLMIAIAFIIIGCSSSSTTNQTANSNQANANTAQTKPTPVDEMASARAVYAAQCARCHGTGGDGGTVEVLKKKLKVPSLKTGHALTHTEDQLAKQIREGGDGMPPFKDKLKPEEISGQVKLIRQEFQKGAAKK